MINSNYLPGFVDLTPNNRGRPKLSEEKLFLSCTKGVMSVFFRSAIEEFPVSKQ